MPRGKYKRTTKIKKKVKGEKNPNYKKGIYCKKQNKQKTINERMRKAREARGIMKKGKDTYLNKKWLDQKYIIEWRSLDNITELCNKEITNERDKVEYDVIWKALKDLGIPNRIMETKEVMAEYKERLLRKS